MKRFLGGVAALLAATVVMSAPAAPVKAQPPSWTSENDNLTIASTPTRGVLWPKCIADAQEYCWEVPSVITPDGVETPIAWGVTPYTYCHDNDVASRAPCRMDGSDWLEVQMTANFSEADSKNTYHWKLRLGTFAPDMLSLGDTQKSIVGGSAADGWTLEMWVKPALFAYRENCRPPGCGQNDKADRVWYTIQGHLHQMPVGATTGMSSSSEAQREALRGAYISTNASTQSWRFGQDTFSVEATSPHFLPDGVTLTPGFVKIWLPPAYVLRDRGYTDISQVKPEFFDMKVSSQTAIPKVEIYNGGLLVDTGITHYSSPNPTMKLKSATETMALQNLAALQQQQNSTGGATSGGGASAAAPSNFVRTAASGAKATLTINLTSAQKVKVFRKVGSKLTLIKTISGKKGTNRFVTVYKKTYSYVVKDAKGKVIPPQLSSAAHRFGLRYLS